jgi:hypothetical protein
MGACPLQLFQYNKAALKLQVVAQKFFKIFRDSNLAKKNNRAGNLPTLLCFWAMPTMQI